MAIKKYSDGWGVDAAVRRGGKEKRSRPTQRFKTAAAAERYQNDVVIPKLHDELAGHVEVQHPPFTVEDLCGLMVERCIRKNEIQGKSAEDTEKAKKNLKGILSRIERDLGASTDFNAENITALGHRLVKGARTHRNKQNTLHRTVLHTRSGLREAHELGKFFGNYKDLGRDVMEAGSGYVPRKRWLPPHEHEAFQAAGRVLIRRLEALGPRRGKHLTPFDFEVFLKLVQLHWETGCDLGEPFLVRLKYTDEDGLRLSDLDLSKGKRGHIQFRSGKNRHRLRWVPMTPAAREAVDWLMANTATDTRLVPEQYDSSGFRRRMEKVLEVVNESVPVHEQMRRFVCKDLRRSFITKCCLADIPEAKTALLVGHSRTSKMITDVYSQMRPEQLDDEIERVASLPTSRQGNVTPLPKAWENWGTRKADDA